MLLAIDAGNTNTVFAAFEHDQLKGAWRCATDARRTKDEYEVLLESWLLQQGLKPRDFQHTIIASVVPDMDFTLKLLSRHVFKCEPILVSDSAVNLDIKVLLPRPNEVGADRLVNAIAARHKYGSPMIIIDFGTATTFDVVDGDGNYCGGVIAPGINLSLQALHMAAAKLPSVNVARPQKVIGTSTIEAMQSGVYWGYVSLIEGIVERIRAEYAQKTEKKMQVIATGGLAPLFQTGTEVIEKVDLDLTLLGLRLIFERNRPAS
jgi:type III pantothenate kinase